MYLVQTLSCHVLSCFSNNFSPKHIIAVKHIMRYLAGTANLAISYSHDHYNVKDILSHVPISYCEADWGNIKIDHHSVSGHLPQLWRSHFVERQDTEMRCSLLN